MSSDCHPAPDCDFDDDSGFDFAFAVQAPFRMQPRLRRLAPGTPQLTALAPGSRHQREKLAVLSAFAGQALLQQLGFDAAVALHALCRHAAIQQPHAFSWDGRRAHALLLRTAVVDDEVEQTGSGSFGLGDEAARCLRQLPAGWRLAGLLCLAFAEDFAVIDGGAGAGGGDGSGGQCGSGGFDRTGTGTADGGGRIVWLAVCLPSHWAPEEKVGRRFAEAHAPVADNAQLVAASSALTRIVTTGERWERFVWNVTAHSRLHAHPQRCDADRWAGTAVDNSWWRTERQTFLPVAGQRLAIFTICVGLQRLADAIDTPTRAATLFAAVASMSPAVLAYRGLSTVREALLDWLDRRQCGAAPRRRPARPVARRWAARWRDS